LWNRFQTGERFEPLEPCNYVFNIGCLNDSSTDDFKYSLLDAKSIATTRAKAMKDATTILPKEKPLYCANPEVSTSRPAS
jgi:hypothetical protein